MSKDVHTPLFVVKNIDQIGSFYLKNKLRRLQVVLCKTSSRTRYLHDDLMTSSKHFKKDAFQLLTKPCLKEVFQRCFKDVGC